jgi:tetratricopeptide (TPR) repeat protein
MALSEIEKLERRYAENPQGLTFAPLAEVHRKNGEVQRALDLLSLGLEIHPNYIPASIVLGRCHLDLGNVHAAETAFLHVLALDGENVIALKSLADISERLLKFDDAERWLHTLLSVDRSNDDAREQLQRVEISRRQAEVASSAEPSSVAESPSGIESPSGVEQSSVAQSSSDAEPSSGVEAQPDISLPPRFEPPIAEPALGWVSQSSQAETASPMRIEDLEPLATRERFEESAGIQLEESARLEESIHFEDSIEPIDGLVGREVDTPDESLDEFRVETAEDIVLESAGGGEFQMPDASLELFVSGARIERVPFEEDAPVAPRAAWEAPPAERTEEVAPEPFVYQPLSEELAPTAYAPYAPELPLSEPAPAEPRAPEPAGPEPIIPPAFIPGDFRFQRKDEDGAEAQPSAPPKRSYGIGETGGRSVAQLFKGMLSARPPAQASAAPVRQAPAADSAGAPTRPAADALSLSSVFGEEAPETPPAVPASNQGAGSVSFDDFFTSPSASPAARTPRAPDPKSDDLDQFHAWLQNLKR